MQQLIEHLRQQYRGRRILILGWGREGQSTYRLLSGLGGEWQLFISDQSAAAISEWQSQPTEAVTALPYLTQLDQVDVIFKTPGIPAHLPELRRFVQRGGRLTSQLNEFLQVYHSQVIGVTGTKGKSTTSTLIAHLLQNAGREVAFGGNIGIPVFELLPQLQPTTAIVIEMSSYQLEVVTASPHIAVFLNLYPEHLNYHQTMEKYLFAKAQITLHQKATDLLIYNQDLPETRQVAALTAAQKLPFSYLNQDQYPQTVQAVLAQLDQVGLPPTVKNWNVLPALLVGDQLGLTAAQLRQGLDSFKTLPHRLETISRDGEVEWIDDTLATIPEATIAALAAVPNVSVLLLGGFDRGISYQKVVAAAAAARIPAVAFFPPSGQRMYDLWRQTYPATEWPEMQVVETMEEAVRFARQHAPAGTAVLLSPASPSFGQFKNYEDKSAQFRDWIAQTADPPPA